MPKSIKKIPTFDLTINLVEKELWKIKEEDEDILDLPVAYLTYDSRKGIWFDRNQQYSRVINKNEKFWHLLIDILVVFLIYATILDIYHIYYPIFWHIIFTSCALF